MKNRKCANCGRHLEWTLATDRQGLIACRYCGTEYTTAFYQRIKRLNELSGQCSTNVGWQCAQCGFYSSDTEMFDIDRILEGHEGGEYARGNVQILCPTCHRKKTYCLETPDLRTTMQWTPFYDKKPFLYTNYYNEVECILQYGKTGFTGYTSEIYDIKCGGKKIFQDDNPFKLMEKSQQTMLDLTVNSNRADMIYRRRLEDRQDAFCYSIHYDVTISVQLLFVSLYRFSAPANLTVIHNDGEHCVKISQYITHDLVGYSCRVEDFNTGIKQDFFCREFTEMCLVAQDNLKDLKAKKL